MEEINALKKGYYSYKVVDTFEGGYVAQKIHVFVGGEFEKKHRLAPEEEVYYEDVLGWEWMLLNDVDTS